MSETKRHTEPRKATFTKREGEHLVGLMRDKHEIVFDEPEDLEVGAGNDEHPSPVDYMFASLVGCQISVLNQCLEKARVEDFTIEADAAIDPESMSNAEIPEEMPSNTAKRIQHIDIDLTVTVPEEYESRASRCLEVYDQGCIVGQSYRAGVQYTPTVHLELTD